MKCTASIVTALSIIALAGACAGPFVSSISDYHPSYNPMNFTSYHAGRDTELRVIGEASFGVSRADLGLAVGRDMHGQHFGRPSNFTLSPGPSAEKNLYVIMAFNVEDDRDLCASAAMLRPRPVTGKTVLQGAWCWSKETYAYVRTEGPAAKPGDPVFSRMVADATGELFTRNPDVELQEEDNNDSIP